MSCGACNVRTSRLRTHPSASRRTCAARSATCCSRVRRTRKFVPIWCRATASSFSFGRASRCVMRGCGLHRRCSFSSVWVSPYASCGNAPRSPLRILRSQTTTGAAHDLLHPARRRACDRGSDPRRGAALEARGKCSPSGAEGGGGGRACDTDRCGGLLCDLEQLDVEQYGRG